MRRGITPFLLIALFLHPRPGFAQVPPKVDPVDARMADLAITWVDWWEANRDTYIRKLLQKGQLRVVAAPNNVPAKVVDALLEATRSDSRNVRAEAALALARMGKGDDRLLELTRDPDERVRCRAWVCLGLLQNVKELLQADKLGDAESLAVVTGLGLLDSPTDKAVDQLRLTARTSKYAEAQRMAIWALRVYHNLDLLKDKKGVDNALLLDLVRTSENPAVVGEALLAMGTIGGWENVPQLIDVARLGSQTSALPGFVEWRLQEKQLKGSDWQAPTMRGAACLALAQLNDATKKPVRDAAAERKAMAARIAILRDNIPPAWSPDAGRGPGKDPGAGPGHFFAQGSVLALARLGDTQTVEDVLRFGCYPPETNLHGIRVINGISIRDPERAYAAIGLAIYGSGSDVLAICAANTREPRNLRAACVLATGLSHRGSDLAKLANSLDPIADARIYGYVVLAMGLQRDSSTLDYASRFGLGGKDAIDPAQILKSDFESHIHCEPQPATQFPLIENMDQELGVRAALLGLAILGDKAAKPALLANWGNDQWITLEASRAMGWCGIYDGVDPMLVLLKQTQKKNIQAWTARCLGEIFDRNQPSNLSRLSEGNFYPFPLKRIGAVEASWIDLPPNRNPSDRARLVQQIEREFHGLDNPFLYWQLLPGIGGEAGLALGMRDPMVIIPKP